MRTSRTNRGSARPKLAYSPTVRSHKISLNAELPLRDHAERALADYFANLNGHRPARLYDLVMREVEEPLFRSVLEYSSGNQSQAAVILGITRATLRKKLREFGISA
jgi:Fis family transcriptional regulator